jgi:deoxyxylulose-5-phosphate synthase
LEENVLKGGFGESVCSYYSQNSIFAEVKCFGVDDEYVCHATVSEQFEACEITEENLKDVINARICA